MIVNKQPEAVCLVRCLGHSQLVSSLSPLVNKLFGGILSWAQALIRLFTERQLSHKVHAYIIHYSCLTHSRGTKNTKKSSCPSRSQLVSSSFITHSQMTKHMASDWTASMTLFMNNVCSCFSAFQRILLTNAASWLPATATTSPSTSATIPRPSWTAGPSATASVPDATCARRTTRCQCYWTFYGRSLRILIIS